MEYFNMNPKFIRIGESSAPAGTVQQLGDILDVGLPPAPKYLKELDNGQYLASLTQVKLLGRRLTSLAMTFSETLAATLAALSALDSKSALRSWGLRKMEFPTSSAPPMRTAGSRSPSFSIAMAEQSERIFPTTEICLRLPSLNPSPILRSFPWQRILCLFRGMAMCPCGTLPAMGSCMSTLSTPMGM